MGLPVGTPKEEEETELTEHWPLLKAIVILSAFYVYVQFQMKEGFGY
jgi:hypothetical protein